MTGRMLYTCTTPGCEVVGHFTDEPTYCSICLEDLAGVYDTTGEIGLGKRTGGAEAPPVAEATPSSTAPGKGTR